MLLAARVAGVDRLSRPVGVGAEPQFVQACDVFVVGADLGDVVFLARADAEGLLFRFYGGVPGWAQLGQPPTVETEILIAPDGRSVVSVLYNGPPRSQPAPGGQPQPPQPGV